MTNFTYSKDLPEDLDLGQIVAIDCETMGLIPSRDRLCVVQLSSGDGNTHIIQIEKGQAEAPNLVNLLSNDKILKLFHFGRFDIAILFSTFGVITSPVYCTKIASKIARTYTDRHGLKNLLSEILDVDISKQHQSSDWGAKHLSKAQIEYAATDVLYLHALREKLNEMLTRENRSELANECFKFLPSRAVLDIKGWNDIDIFEH
ncbi:MAG: ribonuclease D [Pseudomonadota bacterium]|nr:ribonuclease D [Pseudomonadota bacterium]